MRWRRRSKTVESGSPSVAEEPEWEAPPTDIEAFRDRLAAVGLAHAADDLVGLARPSCRLHPDSSIDAASVGISRLGGMPDLPLETPWPMGPDTPLSFIAQINLADATAVLPPNSGVPTSGLLSFFYDAVEQSAWGFTPGDDESWSVIYSPDVAPCERRSWPDGLPDEGRFRAAALRHTPELSFPAAESFDVEQLGIDSPWTTYGRVLGDVDEVISRFLGNPDPVQGDMQVECQLASNGVYCGSSDYLNRPEAKALLAGASAWRLLLQVDSHEDETGMMWGDVGRLYFWIREQDLASGNWDATWMVLQCG